MPTLTRGRLASGHNKINSWSKNMIQNNAPKVNPTRVTQAPVFKLEYSLPPLPPSHEFLIEFMKQHSCSSCQRMFGALEMLTDKSFAVTVTFQHNGKPQRQRFHLCSDCAFKLGTDAARRKKDPSCELWFDIQSQILNNYRQDNPGEAQWTSNN